MTTLAVVAAMLAAALVGRPRPAAQRRLTAMSGVAPADRGGPAGRSLSRMRFLAAAGVLVAGVVMLGGPTGLVSGIAGAVAVGVIRAPSKAVQVDPDDVPVVVDLIAGCLAAGATMPAALDAAAVAAGEVLRDACRSVAAALRAGVPPVEAWSAWFADPWLAPVARTAERTAQTGAAAAEDLLRTSSRLRARRRSTAQHRVRQASVWLVVPLGLCFLPAFVLVAVVPLVVGLLPALR